MARTRLESVDLVRGLVMILMALDHVRDFFAPALPVFFTRWVTHICAPSFFLLTGVGACLSLRRWSRPQLTCFLLTRGLWLIFLEIVVLRCFAWQFNFDYRLTVLVVIWALGWAMIVLAALIHLPDLVTLAFGIAMIAAHNHFDGISPAAFGRLAPLWNILHVPGILFDSPRHSIFLAYPLIPWIGVTAVGFVLGTIYAWDARRRQKLFLRLSLALTAAFFLLRSINLYGDPVRWQRGPSLLATVISFLNTTKYPPSLLFLLMTLGPALLLLRAFDNSTPRLLRPALTFGRVPLFYYCIHAAIIHLIAIAICYARYGQVHWMFESPTIRDYPVTPPPGWGISLPFVYLTWILVVIALYPACRWFAALKNRRTDPWLSYL
jgi:uncharacterized membrane protein